MCIWKQQWGDATSTERLKPGADKSGNKIRPRRAEVFAPPIRGESAGHRRLAPSPIRHLMSDIHPRQPHNKSRPLTRRTLQLNVSAMGLCRLFHDRQAKTGATSIARTILVNPVKSLKHIRMIAKRDSRPVVLKLQDDFYGGVFDLDQ